MLSLRGYIALNSFPFLLTPGMPGTYNGAVGQLEVRGEAPRAQTLLVHYKVRRTLPETQRGALSFSLRLTINLNKTLAAYVAL